MRFRLWLILVVSVLMGPAWGADAPPSEASIRQLLDVMQSHKLVDGMAAEVKNLMLTSAARANGSSAPDPGEQKIIADNVSKLTDLLTQQMSWPQLEPAIIGIYQKSFSQKEVDGLLAFYQSPTGQALIQKMPDIMHQSIMMGQARMRAVLPQVQQINAQMLKELGDYHKAHPVPAKP
jgi:uncharacterized protein